MGTMIIFTFGLALIVASANTPSGPFGLMVGAA